MNAETFAEWIRRQGHQVIKTKNSYWYDAGPRVLQAFPYNWLINPTERELQGMMLKHGIIALRYSTPLTAPEGMASYHVVLSLPYELEMLRPQARNGVKRGMAHFQVKQIPFKRLAEEGWRLQEDTLDRQGRKSSMTQAEWRRICLAAEGLPGFEAWAAISEGELAACLFTNRLDDTIQVPYAMSHRSHLSNHVNNVLFYTVSRDFLTREGIHEVFFGVNSLDAPASVDEFKFRMSIIPKPVRQRTVFNPILKPFANPTTHRIVKRLLDRNPNSRLYAKAEGMLRFHLAGKLPLYTQTWPECLKDAKENLAGGEMIQKASMPRLFVH
jgi:hypothetical protein